jgi:hypothetical protein
MNSPTGYPTVSSTYVPIAPTPTPRWREAAPHPYHVSDAPRRRALNLGAAAHRPARPATPERRPLPDTASRPTPRLPCRAPHRGTRRSGWLREIGVDHDSDPDGLDVLLRPGNPD